MADANQLFWALWNELCSRSLFEGIDAETIADISESLLTIINDELQHND
jgi:hypothetical protein